MKLLTLNIELNKHFSRFIPVVKEENPDVLCIQEIYKDDIEYLKKELGFLYAEFVPMYLLPRPENPDLFDVYKATESIAPAMNDRIIMTNKIPTETFSTDTTTYTIKEMGVATFSKYPTHTKTHCYHQTNQLLVHDAKNRGETIAQYLLESKLAIGEKMYLVGNTHFTWSGQGQFSDRQKLNYAEMNKILNKIPSIILCGDFNSPRNMNGVYDLLAQAYTDNLPATVETTIDEHLHRAGFLPYAVDTIFTTPDYKVSAVSVLSGISDHCGIVATIN